MNFIKSFLAALLAIFITFILLFMMVFILVLSSQRETEPYVRTGSVLEIKLGSTIMERPDDDPFRLLFGDMSQAPVNLKDLEKNLKKAAADDRIEGIWIKTNNILSPWNHLVAFREKLIAFKEESGKFIYVSTDDIGFNEQSYFIATAADSIFSPPETFFEFDGFFMQAAFFKDLLDKAGVEAQIFRTGDYKSAIEPFMKNRFSDENREQLQAIVDNISDTFLEAVEERSGKSRSQLDSILNNHPLFTSGGAYELGFLDELLYPDEVEKRIEKRLKALDHNELRTISWQRYLKVSDRSAGLKKSRSKDKIAVIYAEGNIMPEFETPGIIPGLDENITYNNFQKNLDAALEDDNVKAIVLRISSPGGAGSTSDLLWHSVRKASEQKPVIASFGSVAASGGYYMGMAADTIVASPQTITGSIGVFGLVLNMEELLNKKLGIHFDQVTSHDQALWVSADKPMSETSKKMFQSYIDEFYQVFLERVSLSRDMRIEDVRNVAGGRVWTGRDALDAGLVDVLGELNDAIDIAAEKAEIDDFTIETYPKPKSIFELFSGSAQTQLKLRFHPEWKKIQYLDPLLYIIDHEPRVVIARIPFDHVIF